MVKILSRAFHGHTHIYTCQQFYEQYLLYTRICIYLMRAEAKMTSARLFLY